MIQASNITANTLQSFALCSILIPIKTFMTVNVYGIWITWIDWYWRQMNLTIRWSVIVFVFPIKLRHRNCSWLRVVLVSRGDWSPISPNDFIWIFSADWYRQWLEFRCFNVQGLCLSIGTHREGVTSTRMFVYGFQWNSHGSESLVFL